MEGIPEGLKFANAAGAVSGDLTVIPNNPNPAGIGTLEGARVSEHEGIGPLKLFAGTLFPTAVAMEFCWFA